MNDKKWKYLIFLLRQLFLTLLVWFYAFVVLHRSLVPEKLY